ncbi:membrane-spanning 4-domains subfamily A member 4A-like [Ambystoma mexicanum]|uniref:membrane-spanning 4-domains subfamily A member 4A-like n=1 Tax=Ambystoma mexicanum TaxID=8296 RepID=UPI0037E90FD7
MATPVGNGMYVVTQYIPAVTVNSIQQRTGFCQTPYFLKRFIEGEPKTLGAIQILIGIMQISLGVILCITGSTAGSIIVYSGVPFWASVLYVITGALSVAAERNGTRSLVKASLWMNVMSILFSGTEIIIVGMYLGIDPSIRCPEELCNVRQGIVSVVLILTLLEFCLAFSTSVYGCKSVCCCNNNPEETQPILAVQHSYTSIPGNDR